MRVTVDQTNADHWYEKVLDAAVELDKEIAENKETFRLATIQDANFWRRLIPFRRLLPLDTPVDFRAHYHWSSMPHIKDRFLRHDGNRLEAIGAALADLIRVEVSAVTLTDEDLKLIGRYS